MDQIEKPARPHFISEFRGVRLIEDAALEGKRVAVHYEGEKTIRVSPAMFDLLKSDFDTMVKTIEVLELPRPMSEPKKVGK